MDSVEASYSARAAEYVRLLASMDAVHPSDRQLVTDWARTLDGTILDVGCGPGHWTDHLAAHGCDVRGIDPTEVFVEHARTSYPGTRFDIGRAEALGAASSSVAGILAWYSLIHHEPDAIGCAFDEFARVLRPGGGLLLGFFEGRELEPFEHKVVTAYRWPVPELSRRLDAAGFDVVETHTRTGVGYRPHGAVVATRR